MEIIIVTGLSGSGKSRTMDALEDIGYFCIDNMPPQLISKIVEICKQGKGERLTKVAIAVDARVGDLLYTINDELETLNKMDVVYKILFLDCLDAVLINRYKETRRKHPLDDGISGTESAIKRERDILNQVKLKADYIIDTSLLSVQQLKERVTKLFVGEIKKSIIIHCMSFGFKYGIPTEADIVFDVRFISNPFYVEELKHLTGLDEPVYEYIMNSPKAQELRKRLLDLVDYLIPRFIEAGNSQLVIAIGCTGGKHRSVVFSEILCNYISGKGINASVNHRDITKS